LRVKEMEKSIEEWIYPKEGKRIPQETSRITGGEPWSPKRCWRRRKEEKKDEGAREVLYRPRTQYVRYIRRGSDISNPSDRSEKNLNISGSF
jgi:hypothetical protein